MGATAYVDSPLGHTELHDRPLGPEGPGPGPATPPEARPAPGTPPEGVWTAGSRGSAADGATVSPLPGVVRRVAVRVGDRVDAGAVLVVVEAMKTEHRIAAGRAGRVRRVLVAEGQEVAAGTTVVELEGAADG